MRETVLSNSEKTFVDKAILENLRIDKRGLNEFRDLAIYFGSEYGSVLCTLGDTKVFSQVSCEVSQPKATRPNEGTLFLNVEMGPMAAPHFESGLPLSDTCIQINRVLERTLRDSHCIDLESLCIIAEEKVWNLRIDVAVLNYEGNVMDCACIAAVASLAHFRRPDVTTTGDGEFIIHTAAEKDLIPVVLHHYPICVTYALFHGGKIPVADPTALEERVSAASLILAINSYRELCCMQLTGVSLTSPTIITKCTEWAAERAKRIVEFIKSTLEEDTNERSKGNCPKGFLSAINQNNVLTNVMPGRLIGRVDEDEAHENDSEMEIAGNEGAEESEIVVRIDEKTVSSNNWNDSSDESSSEANEDVEMKTPQTSTRNTSKASRAETVEILDSSEEDETVVLK